MNKPTVLERFICKPIILERLDVVMGGSAWVEALDYATGHPNFRGRLEVMGAEQNWLFQVCKDGQLIRD